MLVKTRYRRGMDFIWMFCRDRKFHVQQESIKGMFSYMVIGNVDADFISDQIV